MPMVRSGASVTTGWRQRLPVDSGADVIRTGIGRAVKLIGDYVSSSDPPVRANNILALVVASNQPFYPLYVRTMAGDDGGASFITLLSTPVFATIPLIARRNAAWAFALLPVAGIANAMLATIALGASAGIELFLIPCALAAMISVYHTGWKIIAGLTIAMSAIYFALYISTDNSIAGLNSQELAALYRLNALSVACLSVFILYTFYPVVIAPPRSGSK